MALQPRLIACGTKMAAISMAIRFIAGPAVMSAASAAVGLRGVHLHAAIVQVRAFYLRRQASNILIQHNVLVTNLQIFGPKILQSGPIRTSNFWARPMC